RPCEASDTLWPSGPTRRLTTMRQSMSNSRERAESGGMSRASTSTGPSRADQCSCVASSESRRGSGTDREVKVLRAAWADLDLSGIEGRQPSAARGGLASDEVSAAAAYPQELSGRARGILPCELSSAFQRIVRHMLCQIVTIPATDWTAAPSSQDVEDAQLALEQGNVLHFTALPFALSAAEGKVLDATLADPKHKNISLPTEGEALRGMLGDTALQETARGLVARFREHALGLVDAWLPHYRGKLRLAPTSLRLNRVEGRKTSWRKDD